jgi:hypothetical protein
MAHPVLPASACKPMRALSRGIGKWRILAFLEVIEAWFGRRESPRRVIFLEFEFKS